jgi:hypothetical protein
MTTKNTNGRSKDGRFQVGNSGGPGRPARVNELEYLKTLTEECGIDTWREIVAAAIKDAKKGDSKSRDWLAAYLCGVPSGRATRLSEIASMERSIEMTEMLGL